MVPTNQRTANNNAADSKYQTIEFHMLQKSKYFPMAMLSALASRFPSYPLILVKTRIQVQRGNELYSGTIDAFRKIIKFDGVRGLYRDFGIYCLSIMPYLVYVYTYECARDQFRKVPALSGRCRSLLSGSCASMASQILVVPIDTVSQYLMVLGPQRASSRTSSLALYSPIKLPQHALSSRAKATYYIISTIRRQYGIKGFYRGYFISLCTYAPISGLWWFFYDTYCSFVSSSLAPFFLPRSAIQCISASASALTISVISNPLDILRSRIQIERQGMISTIRQLWKEEKLWIFTKGLTARMTQSVWQNLFFVLTYETIKRMALHEEYKHKFS